MKKVFLIVILAGVFLISRQASAACSWKAETITTNPEINTSQTSGGCSADEGQPGSESIEKCSEERPAGNSGGFSTTRYVCCCSKEQAAQTLPEPKFTMPVFQIDIPGLDKFSEPECVVVDGAMSCGISWISEFVFAIYTYGLSVVGIIAVLTLMAAGLLWIVSGGDRNKIAKAKDLIIGSTTGLLLIVSMNILLSYVNPDLVKSKALSLSYISDIEPASDEGNPTGSTACNNCTSISAIPHDNREQGILNDPLAQKLLAVYETHKDIYITESYPPTAAHQSKCHYNGMCADIAITKKNYTCEDVHNLINALKEKGVRVLNEYVACNGTATKLTTGGHLHVQ